MMLNDLIIVELIEGFTPIIYMICITMAYYGPNAHLFSNIGSSYWGEIIEDLWPLFATMAFLFAVDTLSILFNSLCISRATNKNILSDFLRISDNKVWLLYVNQFCIHYEYVFSFC